MDHLVLSIICFIYGFTVVPVVHRAYGFFAAILSIFTWAFLVAAICLALNGCSTVQSKIEAPVEVPVSTINADCSMISETIVLTNQTVKLPARGTFVLESNLITKSDDFSGFASTVTEKIDQHLAQSCAVVNLIKDAGGSGCPLLHKYLGTSDKYYREWTPAESGHIGQGSVGDLKPSVVEELNSGNMFWKIKPSPGTKFLACNEGICTVVAVGWETGPRDPQYLGGLQPEIFWFIQAKPDSLITWGRLKDQSLPVGPIECRR